MNFLIKKNLKKMNFLKIVLLAFVLFYLIIIVSTYVFQRSLLYYPSENNYSGDKITVSVKKVRIKTQDNLELVS